MSSAERFEHYGWPVSPYSGKTRSYLRFKGIPFDDIVISAPALLGKVKKAVGRPVMPTVRCPDGTWLQDSSCIIDWFEERFDEPSITPPGGTQRLASLLLELHGDEWLPTVAMHTRWNNPTNKRFALDEFARCGFPWLPRFIGRPMVSSFANKMQSYLPILGVTDETSGGIERYTRQLIAHLDQHLSAHPFLLGGRPCLGDFALFGPLWAHVYRDPGTTPLFDEAPAVRAWFERLIEPSGEAGEFLADDEVPASLDPILAAIFAEQFPFVCALVAAVDSWCDEHPDATRVSRAFGSHPMVIGGAEGERRLVTFTQWMAQRPVDAYAALEGASRASADAWLERVGGQALQDLRIRNRQVMRDFKLVLESPPGDA